MIEIWDNTTDAWLDDWDIITDAGLETWDKTIDAWMKLGIKPPNDKMQTWISHYTITHEYNYRLYTIILI